jgi:hypothetical protein
MKRLFPVLLSLQIPSQLPGSNEDSPLVVVNCKLN